MRWGKLCFFNALLFAHLLFCIITITIIIITIIIVVNYEAVYSPLFFHKFVRIKCSMVWVAILVSYVHVLRWQALGLIAVGGGRRKK